MDSKTSTGLIVKFILSLMFVFFLTPLHAESPPIIWYTHASGEQVTINVDLFLSSTCPYCQKADAFFREQEKKKPWLSVHRHVINQDKVALQTFYERLQQQHSNNFAIPAMFFCDSRWAGFGEAETTGKTLLKALSYCHKKISQQGELTPAVISVLQKWGNANQFQVKPSMSRSAPLFAALMGLMEAFSPCSFFCLAAFLAFLWLYPSQKSAQFGVGVIFLLALGINHYFQQVYSVAYYQLMTKLSYMGILVGLLLLLTVLNASRKVFANSVMKPGLFIFVVVLLTAFSVQILQQTCVFNASLILDQWMLEQAFTPAKKIYYQSLFQVFYLLPMVLLLGLYLLFEDNNGKPRYQHIMKIAACLTLICIAIIMMVSPALLANITVSVAVPLVSVLMGWLVVRRDVQTI